MLKLNKFEVGSMAKGIWCKSRQLHSIQSKVVQNFIIKLCNLPKQVIFQEQIG